MLYWLLAHFHRLVSACEYAVKGGLIGGHGTLQGTEHARRPVQEHVSRLQGLGKVKEETRQASYTWVEGLYAACGRLNDFPLRNMK